MLQSPLTSTNKVNFAGLWQWLKRFSVFQASQRGWTFTIVDLNGVVEKKIAVLIVHLRMLLVVSET